MINTKFNNGLSPGCQKKVKMSIKCDTAKRYVSPPIPFAYQQNRYDSGFVDHRLICSSTSSDSNSSEYAEPDCENLSEPLIKMCSNDERSMFNQTSDSIHYASSPINGTLQNDSTIQPLSSFERFSHIDQKFLCNMPVLVEFNVKALNLVEHIGSGEFGKLDVCTLERTRHVFVKYTNSDSRSLRGFEREKRVMSQLRHQNICEHFGVVVNNGLLGSILEFPAQGDLPNWVRNQQQTIRFV